MAFAKSQAEAKERVKKKRALRRAGVHVNANIRNTKLNRLYKAVK